MAYPRLTIMDDRDAQRVHDATVRVLEEAGVEVLHEPTLALLREAGASVDGTRVRMGAELVDAALESAAKTWPLEGRAGAAGIELRQGRTYFGTGSDCLFIRDRKSEERRRVLLADVETMAHLADKLPNLDFVMSMGLPGDVEMRVDDLAPVAAMLRGTSKPLIVAPKDGAAVEPILEMAQVAGNEKSVCIYSMPAPPLMHDADAITKVVESAKRNVPLVYASAPSMGSTSPWSVAATLVVGNAEILSGLVVHQLVNPGAPFIYGTAFGVLDMALTVESYAAPEQLLTDHVGCELAEFYGLPSFYYGAVSDSKLLDPQWAAESAVTAMLGALSRGTLLHDVGYLESGMQSSHESIVLGDEVAGFARAILREMPFDDDGLAVDEILWAGPGGNHLSRKYTRQHYREMWRPSLFERATYDRWMEETGGRDLLTKIRERTEELLAEPRAEALDDATSARLDEIVAAADKTRAAAG
jgi:trimethylamine--corrinoid protein Co-methyltransferase